MVIGVRSKQTQYSLFDIIVNQIDELEKENKLEDNLLEELLYGSRQTNRPTGHLTQTTLLSSNQSRVRNSVQNSQSLLDIGQMVTQQPRKTIDTREIGSTPLSGTPLQTMANRGGRDGDRGILRHGDRRHEPVGNLSDNGSGYRTLGQATSNYIPVENAFAPKQEDIDMYNQYLDSLKTKETTSLVTSKNYKITPADNLGQGGAKTKFQDNINAIKLLNTLNSKNEEFANDGEQKILAP